MRPNHPLTALLAVGFVLASAGCQTVTQPQRSSATATAVASGTPMAAPAAAASPDYDGDGKADLAATRTEETEALGVRIKLGAGPTVDLTAAAITPDASGIAAPLLSGDLNSDGFSDLVFVTRDGRLTVVPGSPSGLQLAARQSLKLPTTAAPATAFPMIRSLALVESPVRRLAVGLINPTSGVGEVILVQVNALGAPSGTPTLLKPGTAKLPKLKDAGSFGSALAGAGSQLFIGAPSATVSGVPHAGAMMAVTLGASGVVSATTITQATKGVTGAVAKNDFFGASVAARDGYLAVGTYGDAVGSVKSTGSVQIFTLSKGKVTPKTRLSQASTGVPGKAEKYDQFGRAVALATSCSGVPAVVVGAPAEVITAGHESDGSAWLIPLTTAKGCAARQLYEGHGLSGTPGFSVVGFMLAAIRDRGAVADDLVIIGPGSYSEGPEGMLFRWSSASLTTTYRADGFYRSAAGR